MADTFVCADFSSYLRNYPYRNNKIEIKKKDALHQFSARTY